MPLPPPNSAKLASGPSVDQLDDLDRIIGDLGQEFLADASDTLARLGIQITQAVESEGDTSQLLADVRRETHNLKGLGRSYGYPAISVIAHRLENYLTAVERANVHQLEGALQFLDRMQEIADSGVDPGDEELSRIVRALPAKGSAMADYNPVSDLEVLLVASSRILARAIEGELNRRGYRVVMVKSPIDVFETAIRTRPDMIIASAVMDGIGGVDLARALKVIDKTAKIPFVLLTSFDTGHTELRDLPVDAALVHHDRDIDAELTSAVERFGLTA